MSTTTTTELMPVAVAVQASPVDVPSFLELEITGFCQLKLRPLLRGKRPGWRARDSDNR